MTMDHGMCNIETGTSINIKRTDGRVHSAIVSGVNWEQRSVTVEWFERGETKGKEVEIDAILALNPDLNPKPMGPPPQVDNSLASSRATRHTTRPSIPVKAASNRQIPRQTNRMTNIMPAPPPVNGHGETIANITGRREVENIPPTVAAQVGSNVTVSHTNKQKQIQQQQQQQAQQQQQQQQSQQSQAQVENGRGRRSNVVKEVERLKKNREERRQRQAELKEEKEALMNLDPGNVNWEFLAMIREYRNGIEYRPLRESDSVEDHQITVCVRKRPLNKKEMARKEVDVITVPSKDQMVVHEPKSKVDLTKYLDNQVFRFDYAFDDTCSNELVYKYTAKPLVQTIFEGGMATCFAYGQTGSGKTHTMGGDFNGKTQDCEKGIYAMVAKDVFKCLKMAKYKPLNLIISASFFEIYSGKVFDLLSDKEKLRVLEDGKQQVQIVGLTEKVVETCDEVLKLIQHGNSARTSGQTSANSNSSRSHAVFQIIVRTPGTHKVHGKFSLIDLAGNERGADTSSANRQTRMEGAEINKSLLALKECIRALSRKGTHLPFRASKLTQVLRDSFIGEKSKTCMIAMISPGMSSCEHSLNTLRYADRVKELAATDPTEVKSSPTEDERVLKIEEEVNNSTLSDSDLAQLRSLNEGEISQDLYTFHEAVSALQIMEEEVLDTHKVVMDNTTRFLNNAHSVFSATHEVDYDQEDSQSKTKANSIFTISQHLDGTDMTLNTSFMIDRSTHSMSDYEVQSSINSSCNVSIKDTLKSPWRNETGSTSNFNCKNDDEDSNTVLKPVMKSILKKKRIINNKDTSKKICFNKNVSLPKGTLTQKLNQSNRIKRITPGKKSRFCWSGTFAKENKNIASSGSTNKSPFKVITNQENPGKSNIYSDFFYGDKPFIKSKVFYANVANSNSTESKIENTDDTDYKLCSHFDNKELDDDLSSYMEEDVINDNDYDKPQYTFSIVNSQSKPKWLCLDDKNFTKSENEHEIKSSKFNNSNTSLTCTTVQNKLYDFPIIQEDFISPIIKRSFTSQTHFDNSAESVKSNEVSGNNQEAFNLKKWRSVNAAFTILYKVFNIVILILKNLILFLFLPIAYVAWFVYLQGEE